MLNFAQNGSIGIRPFQLPLRRCSLLAASCWTLWVSETAVNGSLLLDHPFHHL